MNLGSQIIYKELFERYERVRIPMMQRDYAQGRLAAEEVREEFLNALWEALLKPLDDPTLPLNLDFIYGSVEGDYETRFLPLDGQQRLTTLFLLHWYLAWVDDQWNEFRSLFQAEQYSRFAYSVRPSCNEFFDAFVAYRPTERPDNVSNLEQLISDQPWYFRSWRLDPTIKSVLCMLDAIHARFAASTGLFKRLIDEVQPVITFQLLDLENFGLSDDLYIKMNGRGKPLTEFENFKARYEQELEKQFDGIPFTLGEQIFSAAQYVALRMDTAWTDLVWTLRDTKSNLYDAALTNIFRAVTLVTRSPDSDAYLSDIFLLRDSLKAPSYTDFHLQGWLDERFTWATISLLDAWSKETGKFYTLLPDSQYFDERAIFDKIVVDGARLSYVELVQFAAYVGFIARHQDAIHSPAFQEWMRIVYNLSENTAYNRADDFRRSIAGLNVMLEYSGDILKHFANSDNPANGFSLAQIAEEKLKAEIILAEHTWRNLIDRAERHGYFCGQIEFLLDFSGIRTARAASTPESWVTSLQAELKGSFLNYLQLAEQMFTDNGVRNQSDYKWQRALLSVGDYLLPSGQNYSLLIDGKNDPASWKRLLRGTGEHFPGARKILHQLWNKLSPDQLIGPQLERIIADTVNMDSWRTKLAQTPEAIAYCGNQLIRKYSADEIYLLSKIRMTGLHAELFTYCLYHTSLIKLGKAGLLQPLNPIDYVSAAGIGMEPGIRLTFSHNEHIAYFDVEYYNGQYKCFVFLEYLKEWHELFSLLIRFGFVETESTVTSISSSENIEALIIELAKELTAAFPNS